MYIYCKYRYVPKTFLSYKHVDFTYVFLVCIWVYKSQHITHNKEKIKLSLMSVSKVNSV